MADTAKTTKAGINPRLYAALEKWATPEKQAELQAQAKAAQEAAA